MFYYAGYTEDYKVRRIRGDRDGWHVSLRGYKKDWDFPEVMP